MTTQESHPVAYALGVSQVEAETYRRERDTALRMLARLAESYATSGPGSLAFDIRMDEVLRLLGRAAS